MTTSKSSTFDGIKLYFSKRYGFRCDPGRTVQVKVTPRVKKERKPALKGKYESVFSGRHMDSVPKETHVVSVMIQESLATVARVRVEKDDRLLLHPTRRQNRLTARDTNPPRDQAINRKTRNRRAKFHADSNSVKNPSCRFRRPPVGLSHKSRTSIRRPRLTARKKHRQKHWAIEMKALRTKGVKFRALASSRVSKLQLSDWMQVWLKLFFRHVKAEEKPSKKSKKGGAKGPVATLKESIQLGCVSQDSVPSESLFFVNKGDSVRSTLSKFSNGTEFKFGKERVHREELSKSVRIMSVVFARQNSGKIT